MLPEGSTATTPRGADGSRQEPFIYSPRDFLNLELESRREDQEWHEVGEFYELGELLGEGGWGKVYSGTRLRDQTVHALKIIQKTDIDWKLLTREVGVLQQLEHPNILQFHELILTPDECVIVTELLSGGELYSRLVKLEKLSESAAHGVVKALLSAICYAHQRGIMHRDLKPENIMLVSDEDDCPIKIIDWGLARPLSGSKRLSSDIGTPSYTAPEILGTREYGAKCDLWSIGVITFELLVGYLPFDAFDCGFLATIERGEFQFKEDDWEEISPSAKDLIRKLLNPDPDLRISAQEALGHPWVRLGVTKATPLRAAHINLARRVQDREKRKSYILHRSGGGTRSAAISAGRKVRYQSGRYQCPPLIIDSPSHSTSTNSSSSSSDL